MSRIRLFPAQPTRSRGCCSLPSAQLPLASFSCALLTFVLFCFFTKHRCSHLLFLSYWPVGVLSDCLSLTQIMTISIRSHLRRRTQRMPSLRSDSSTLFVHPLSSTRLRPCTRTSVVVAQTRPSRSNTPPISALVDSATSSDSVRLQRSSPDRSWLVHGSDECPSSKHS